MPPRKPSVNLPRVKTDTLSDGRIGVTGDTRPIKDRLKAAGGRWHAEDKVWYLPAGTDLAFLSEPPCPDNVPNVTTKTLPDGRITVKGATFDDTYAIRDRLKAAAARWNASEKVWILPAGTDIAFLKEPLPPPPPEWELQGLCCAEAKRYGYDLRRNEVFCRAHGLKPWWFCCSEAKVISAARQSCSCAVHTQSDPYVACILVRGQRYTGD